MQGVILYGEPGTGKTLLAKAVANSTSATFLRVVGSELIQKYLGDGPKLVRELFRVAEELAPTIVFIGTLPAALLFLIWSTEKLVHVKLHLVSWVSVPGAVTPSSAWWRQHRYVITHAAVLLQMKSTPLVPRGMSPNLAVRGKFSELCWSY